MSVLLSIFLIVLAVVSILFALTTLPRIVGSLVFRMSKALTKAPKP